MAVEINGESTNDLDYLYNDLKFCEIRDLLYDAESYDKKGFKQTAYDVLEIARQRLVEIMNKLYAEINP